VKGLKANFIDISGYQHLSQDDFYSLKKQGIEGAVIKLSEWKDPQYDNPLAQDQIKFAKKAGMKVSVYHYVTSKDKKQEKQEAAHFIDLLKKYKLPKSTVVVADMESPHIYWENVTSVAKQFRTSLKAAGYKNVMYYSIYAWYQPGGLLDAKTFGKKNCWVASHVNTVLTKQHTDFAAWQWTSTAQFEGIGGAIDANIDYTGRFTK
jgi:GH25 family lysozyme M1 (1,4-beta-N-acetylmuramidase)